MDNRLLKITCLLFMACVTFMNVMKAEADDSIAMLKLASALTGAPASWSNESGRNYCNWEGVRCDNSSNLVIAINLSGRNIGGNIPPELSTLSQLRYLDLDRNQFSGPLPSFANMSSLLRVRLGDNQFTSIPPGFFQGLSSLQSFDISQNRKLQTWHLPNDLALCTRLEIFRATEARIQGTIPDVFSSLRRLRNLDLSYNFLQGTLPPSFVNSTIQNLWLSSYNYMMGLSGSIDVLVSMTQLRTASLSHNYFTGPIPNLSNCTNLISLNLSSNYLTGLIPISLVSHPSLINVSLSYNYLQGPIPMIQRRMKITFDENNFCELTEGALCDPVVTIFLNISRALQYPLVLAQNWKGNNACLFSNFVTCDTKHRVVRVNLARRNLSGRLSQDLSNLMDLTNLMLNDNNLTGSIPDGLTKLPNLQVLDISNNNLSGILPNFSSSVKVFANGNPLLVIPDGSKTRQKKSPEGRRKVVIIVVGVTVSVFLSVMLFVFFIYKAKKRLKKSTNGVEYHTDEDGVHGRGENGEGKNAVISIKFLRQVTNNFSEANVLGRGGFGVVYKGELDDGACIAVKRMDAAREMNGFQAEIKVLTRVRHRRLVTLLGYCFNKHEKILVYEYMPQGTLQQHLFEWHERGFHPLTWTQRVTIALDVARGVEYLHSLALETFIHRDLKPSNILLNDDMRAKVADFGLVKRTTDGRNSTETKVAGTFGYLAPEYAATGKVTTKVDVYAFGVILMEMITGKKAVDETVSKEGWMYMHLVTWFRNLLVEKDDITSAIDRTLNPDEKTLLSIAKVAELAGHCATSKPHQRPDMSYVVNTLACLVEQWTPPSPDDQVNNLFDSSSFQLDIHFQQNMQVNENNSTNRDSNSWS